MFSNCSLKEVSVKESFLVVVPSRCEWFAVNFQAILLEKDRRLGKNFSAVA